MRVSSGLACERASDARDQRVVSKVAGKCQIPQRPFEAWPCLTARAVSRASKHLLAGHLQPNGSAHEKKKNIPWGKRKKLRLTNKIQKSQIPDGSNVHNFFITHHNTHIYQKPFHRRFNQANL